MGESICLSTPQKLETFYKSETQVLSIFLFRGSERLAPFSCTKVDVRQETHRLKNHLFSLFSIHHQYCFGLKSVLFVHRNYCQFSISTIIKVPLNMYVIMDFSSFYQQFYERVIQATV